MKKTIICIGIIMIAFAIMLPLASSNPDGLQQLTEQSATNQQPTWNGIFPNYLIEAVQNPYLSTLLAGISGSMVVIFVSLILAGTFKVKKKIR